MGHYACDMRPEWFGKDDKPKKKAPKKTIAGLADRIAHNRGVYTHGEPPNKTEGDAWWTFTEVELKEFIKQCEKIK